MDVAYAISDVRKYVSGISCSVVNEIVGQSGDMALGRIGDRIRAGDVEMGKHI